MNVTDSNVVMEFSNGIVFTYADGKCNASLNGTYADVKGKYLITTEFGLIKISYNPKNREFWWVYEPFAKK